MKLSEFVRDTLIQIAEGVDSSRKEVSELDALINPVWRGAQSKPGDIQFDVALIVSDEDSANGGIKVWGMGGELESKSKETSVSRIKFSVPLLFKASR